MAPLPSPQQAPQQAAAPRLCQVYVQDMLQFLPRQEMSQFGERIPRGEVEGLREVSRAMKTAVDASRLPRRIFYELSQR
jgi:hypothetical protein